MSRRKHPFAVPLSVALVAGLAAAGSDVQAQTAVQQDAQQASTPKPGDDTVVVTATRREQPSLLLPAGVDRLFGEEIRFGRPQVNLSESIGRVPGIVVQNRQNYAQDLQVHSRGFGSRSTFGIRGLRLYQDGIPASMPDGQGQASSFDLGSAQRIEVLRGAPAALYGNSAGGVINVITEDGPAVPEARADFWAGSFGTRRSLMKVGGESGPLNVTASGGDFITKGWREHSSARRQQFNAKLRYALAEGTSATLLLNSVNQPETQDALGLSRAQLDANPRGVDPSANTFNTRKSLGQDQAGLSLTHALSGGGTLVASAHGGVRNVRQYLGIPVATQLGTTHSGGVVDLGREFNGAGLRLSQPMSLFGMDSTLTAGLEYETQKERRTGYVNNNGVQGALKRNEDDAVGALGGYGQMEVQLAPKWIATAGGRMSRVEFKSSDYYVAAGNGDDSGRRVFSAFTPTAGLLYRATPDVSVYANTGRSFETPTFTELAYRLGGTGLNFALLPARSNQSEAGVKARLAEGVRVNAALFDIDSRDEIVTESNAGGRATFKNAGRTSRRGAEFSLNAALAKDLDAYLAWTWVDARFREAFSTVRGTPAVPVTVGAGNRIPGIARANLYAELRWRHAPSGFSATLEVQRKEKVMVSDDNSDFADGYTVANLSLGLTQRGRGWSVSEFLRADNLAGTRYVGSVIVNDANLRFFEPAPGRSLMAGVQATLSF